MVNTLAELDRAVEAHRRWFVRMRLLVESELGGELPELSTVADDQACEFGRWLHTRFPPALRQSPIYREITRLHSQFHESAVLIMAMVLRGERGRALQELMAGSQFNSLSLTLVGRLQQLKEELEIWAAA